MTNEVRKDPSELLTRYELEPSITDIYVEGELDSSFIKWFIKEKGFNQVNVYPIKTVSVDVEEKLPNNNKGRVITLCRYLNKNNNNNSLNHLAIIDLDRDHILENEYDENCLLVTNFTSLDFYLLNDNCLRKFFLLSLRIEYENTKKLFSRPLKQLFILQAVNEALDLNLKSIPFTKLIDLSEGQFNFDFKEYYNRVIHKNNLYDREDEIDRKYEEFSYLLDEEFHKSVNYHDYIRLLSYYLIKEKNKDEFTKKVIDYNLISTNEIRFIDNFKFFQDILTILDQKSRPVPP